MSLKVYFDQLARDEYTAEKENNFVLRVAYGNKSYTYDFMARVMIMETAFGSSHATVTPFSQLSQETLENFHAILVEKQGTPPPLAETEKDIKLNKGRSPGLMD